MTPPHAIVAGYGIVGRYAAEGLKQSGFDVSVLEINPVTIKNQSALGRRAIHGDARNADDLRAAGIDTAKALILTMPDENDAIEACRVAYALQPKLFIVARTNFVSKGLAALQSGADYVVIQEVVTAQAMRDVVVQNFASSSQAPPPRTQVTAP